MLWEVWRYFTLGWIDFYWVEPRFYFTYPGFDWIRPWPGLGMDLHWMCLGILATGIMLGAKYRICTVLFFVGFTFVFLLDQATYLNHFYLIALISFLLIFIPAHRNYSIDALREPHLSSSQIPAWNVWLLRFQIGIPYFFGGVAKLNEDWLRGEPLRLWMERKTDFPIIGQWFINEAMVWLMTYGAVIVDLAAVFLLLNRRTRIFGFLLLLIFNLMNSRLFTIGIFPWFMIVATLVFFEPDWPRRVFEDIKRRHPFRLPALLTGLIVGFMIGVLLPSGFSLMHALIGAIGVAVTAYHLDEPFRNLSPVTEMDGRQPLGVRGRKRPASDFARTSTNWWIAVLLSAWILMQVSMPLRHLIIPGNVSWTDEGYFFSWHMVLKDKRGIGEFTVINPKSGRGWAVDPRDFLSEVQLSKMSTSPPMILEFAEYLEELLEEDGYEGWEVRGRFLVSLNGRKLQLLVNPDVDLTEVSQPWMAHADWILPLETPLNDRLRD